MSIKKKKNVITLRCRTYYFTCKMASLSKCTNPFQATNRKVNTIQSPPPTVFDDGNEMEIFYRARPGVIAIRSQTRSIPIYYAIFYLIMAIWDLHILNNVLTMSTLILYESKIIHTHSHVHAESYTHSHTRRECPDWHVSTQPYTCPTRTDMWMCVCTSIALCYCIYRCSLEVKGKKSNRLESPNYVNFLLIQLMVIWFTK